MKKILLTGVAAVAITAATASLDATSAQAVEAAQNGPMFFGYLEGMYALKSNGGKTYQGYFAVPSVRPDDGYGIEGMIGMRVWENWDVAVAGGYAGLGRGKESSPGDPVDSYQIDKAKSWYVDGTVGYNTAISMADLRLFGGVRYREWKQESDLVQPGPPNCCGFNTKAKGIGPLLGFSGNIPLNETFGLFGGADVAILFGSMRYRRGPGSSGLATGHPNQTMIDVGAKAGINFNLSDNIRIGVGYKLNHTTKAAMKNARMFSGSDPSGRVKRVVHGPFARLSIDLSQ